MTLGEFFALIGSNPTLLFLYFGLLPLFALLTNIMGKGEGNTAPWNYLYSTLVFLACIPGILAVTLDVYFFLFERGRILDTNIYTQILPIISMVATLLIVRQNADFAYIPGFDKLSALMSIIACVMICMIIIDKTRFIVFTNLPFQYVILAFFVLYIVIRMSWSKIFTK
jgi:hypothetical protein